MERIGKTCEAPFEVEFARQLNCGSCKQKKTVYKQTEREERGLAKLPDASDYVSPHADTLAKHAAETLAKVKSELPDKKLTLDDSQVVEQITETLLGLENGWTEKVTLGKNPTVQMLIGGHFVDAVAATSVERVHLNPTLLLSETFRQMYQKFLQMVVEWSKKNQQYVSPDLIKDVHAGLSGSYVLKITKRLAAPAPDVPEISADEPSTRLPPPQRVTTHKPCLTLRQTRSGISTEFNEETPHSRNYHKGQT